MALRQAVKDGRVESPAPGQATVALAFDDGTKYKLPGRLLFSESTVDETTGQITMRAEFPNPDGDLLPGMYVRVELEQGVQQAALTVPEQAVQRDSGGKAQVYTVDTANKVQLRTVELGQTVGAYTIVTSGLANGERVITEGFQKIRPGDTVTPQEWKPDAVKTSDSDGAAGAG
jgi:membrane fusion protein (multidrug efflux system)